MARSIMQDRKECYITGTTANLQEHHCLFGKLRKFAEKHGLKVWLNIDYHTGKYGVHSGNEELKEELQRQAQRAYMTYYGADIEDFIKAAGRNYLVK